MAGLTSGSRRTRRSRLPLWRQPRFRVLALCMARSAGAQVADRPQIEALMQGFYGNVTPVGGFSYLLVSALPFLPPNESAGGSLPTARSSGFVDTLNATPLSHRPGGGVLLSEGTNGWPVPLECMGWLELGGCALLPLGSRGMGGVVPRAQSPVAASRFIRRRHTKNLPVALGPSPRERLSRVKPGTSRVNERPLTTCASRGECFNRTSIPNSRRLRSSRREQRAVTAR